MSQSQFGQYTILEQIGSGGMASVYQAIDNRTGTTVALKILHDQYNHAPEVINRFRQEAHIASQLKHPHIVSILDFGNYDGKAYMVQEYMERGSLLDYFNGTQSISLNETVQIIQQIASGLSFAHSKGIVHRDLKLANILIDNQNNMRLADFGIAHVSDATRMTATGMMPGTPHYMAPEQIMGQQNIDQRADIYSLAVLAYLLVTGHFPFTAPQQMAVLNMHLQAQPPRPSLLVPALPRQLDNVVLKGLEKQRERRYSHAQEFAQELQRAVGNIHSETLIQPQRLNPALKMGTGNMGLPIVSTQGGRPIRRASTRWVLPALGILGLVIAVGLFFLTRQLVTESNLNGSTQATIQLTESTSIAGASVLSSPVVTIEPTTPSPSETPTEVDVELAAQFLLETQQAAETATLSFNQTETATQWTKTPTPDVTASVEALLVQWQQGTATQEILDLTSTAMQWTATYTPTFTWTPTATATFTFTPTNTATQTFTPTNTATSTHTATATKTPTNTATPTHTATATKTPTRPPIPTKSPLEIARIPVTSNNKWKPYEQDFGGVTMVLVPAGCFTMGNRNGEVGEQPVHQQCFDEPFWIDKYEATNAQFGGGDCENWSSQPNQPRICVTWFQARNFCADRGMRLPTEKEWEYAARGPDSLLYPWGNTFVGQNVVHGDTPQYGYSHTAPVGSAPGGASWVGAMDLSGNVWEWTSSLYQDYPYQSSQETNADTISSRVLRGGSFDDAMSVLRSTWRGNIAPEDASYVFGFRCAKS